MATATMTASDVDDGWFIHFLRFLLVGILFAIPIVGWIWAILTMSKVGYRKRDVLFFLVPIWGMVVGVRAQWRYAAKSVYWSVRADRPSSTLFS